MEATCANMMTTDVESLRYQRSLEAGVNLFRDGIDEKRGDSVDFQQVRPQLGVDEDVQAEQVEVIVERSNACLHNTVNILMTAKPATQHVISWGEGAVAGEHLQTPTGF